MSDTLIAFRRIAQGWRRGLSRLKLPSFDGILW